MTRDCVDPADLERSLRRETRLVSVMAANNVTALCSRLRNLARIASRHGALFHTDAVQAAGKIPLNVRRMSIDLLSLSAHKLHGPKGVAARCTSAAGYRHRSCMAEDKRAGCGRARRTSPGIVGFGAAAEIAQRGNGRRGRTARANPRLPYRFDR